MPMPSERERIHLLQACRRAMPGVAGVVLSSLSGGVLAHDGAPEPAALARTATALRLADTSALVERDGARYLVMFLPDPPMP